MMGATQNHLPSIRSLLSRGGLPTDDLGEQDLSLFRVLVNADAVVAVGGLERCGEFALVRSVATSPASRGQGLGRQLVEALEELAEAQGCKGLYLLTESAETFFEALGYEVINRADAPEPIRRSRQYSQLCPDSATVMRKRVVID